MKSSRSLVFAVGLLASLYGILYAQGGPPPMGPRTRTVCEDVIVYGNTSDSNQFAGMALGGVAGGFLGNQIGGGRGRTLATVAGVLGGGYAGRRIQQNQQASRTHVERRCHVITY